MYQGRDPWYTPINYSRMIGLNAFDSLALKEVDTIHHQIIRINAYFDRNIHCDISRARNSVLIHVSNEPYYTCDGCCAKKKLLHFILLLLVIASDLTLSLKRLIINKCLLSNGFDF